MVSASSKGGNEGKEDKKGRNSISNGHLPASSSAAGIDIFDETDKEGKISTTPNEFFMHDFRLCVLFFL